MSDKVNQEFRESLKLLLHSQPEVTAAQKAKKHVFSELVAIFFRSAFGKQHILLPPHPVLLKSFDAAHQDLVKEHDEGPASSTGSGWQPKSLLNKAMMWDTGSDGDFLQPHSFNGRFRELTSVPASQDLVSVAALPIRPNKGVSQAMELCTKVALQASSYQFHFLDGAQDAVGDLPLSVTDLLAGFIWLLCGGYPGPAGYQE